MAVKLRLKRMGAKARPFYRIVAADSRSLEMDVLLKQLEHTIQLKMQITLL